LIVDLGVLQVLALLLICQLIGEVASRAANLPVPGPVLGMVLLLLVLLAMRRVPAALERTARRLLDNLSLLFVPAGVGVIAHLDILRRQWLPIAAAIVGSTVLAMLVTALSMLAVEALSARRSHADAAGDER
jgi:holin-like protein